MLRKIRNILKLAILFLATFLYVLFAKRDFRHILNFFRSSLFEAKKLMNQFCINNPLFFSQWLKPQKVIADYSEFQLSRLKNTTAGLYAIQKSKTGKVYTYSIIVPVYKPKATFFRTLLESCVDQSVDDSEVLLGLDGPQPQDVHDVITQIKSRMKDPNRLRVFDFERNDESKGISSTTNKLAKNANGQFLVFIDHDDWVRPDLLYRYDLMLRNSIDPNKTVLFCDEFKIDEFNNRLGGTYLRKSDVVPFPYVFVNWICHCLLVPRVTFMKMGGLRSDCDGAQDYDLILRLDIEGMKFVRCPVALYAWRVHALSTAQSTGVKSYGAVAGLKAIKSYIEKKNLDWAVQDGIVDTTYLAIPKVSTQESVHVVIPFKDNFELTAKAVESLFRQKNTDLKITLINNNSQEKEINQRLRNHLGQIEKLEIIDNNEPFNFSRLCNLGADSSRFRNTKNILFMNNDVELNENAVEEMVRWIRQENIGVVGCKLKYANEQLQHGGIDCRDDNRYFEVCWAHTNYQFRKDMHGFHDVQRIVDAVTGACMLVRRELFEQIKGFDEEFFPIAFSDTDLCARVQKLGYYVFYNPLAEGFHYESITRAKNAVEDFESSRDVFKMRNNNMPVYSFYYR